MSSIENITGTLDSEEGFWDRITDENVKHLYMIRGSPWLMLTILSLYLAVVLYLGPRLMSKREAYKLNKLIFCYNLLNSGINLWIFIGAMRISNYGWDALGCNNENGADIVRGVYLTYIFYMIKYLELLDTIFFVLRKKNNQISFLHVFHHTSVPIFCWILIKTSPKMSNALFPILNSFIHVIMYLYYALSTLGPKVQPYLWWKRYLTKLQMTQFLLVMGNALYTSLSKNCAVKPLYLYMNGSMASIFLILFAMFYRDAYKKRKSQDRRDKLASAGQVNKSVYEKLSIASTDNKDNGSDPSDGITRRKY